MYSRADKVSIFKVSIFKILILKVLSSKVVSSKVVSSKALLFLMLSFSLNSFAECRDAAAIDASNKKAMSYFKESSVFHQGVIQKVHHPSRKKEVASYIKTGQKHYSIFTLVDENCRAVFRKRTRQED